MILGEKEKTLFGMVTREMKLEIWTDLDYKERPGIWNLCDVRGITNYFTGDLKRVEQDKFEENENVKIYFADRTIMDNWDIASKVLLLEDYSNHSSIKYDFASWRGNRNIFLPVFQRNINWCKEHNVQPYIDMCWESIDDHYFHSFKDSRLWKYIIDNDIKIVCHTPINHPNLIDINRFFELEFTSTLYRDVRNHSSLFLKPKWNEKKKYFYCSHMGCISTKYEIQRFLVHAMEEKELWNDEFFWSVLNKRPKLGEESPYYTSKYKHLFNANTWESRTVNYYDSTTESWDPSNYKSNVNPERRISPQMIDSECYVVFENNYAYHTEKTVKAIYAQLPFIIFAPPYDLNKTGIPGLLNANARLKKHGYEIFEEVFDYSFEDKENTEDMMDEFIKELIRVKKEGRKIWQQPSVKEKIRYNHYLLLKRASTEEMMKYLYEIFSNDK